MVADVDFACDPATKASLEAQHGLAIRSESITFTGLCRDCGTLHGGGAAR
jgi:Fe2+ or Zn2+ uptake regulation protein